MLKNLDDLTQAVLDVTVVPVAPSSVVTELFENVWVRIGKLLNRSPRLSPKSVR